MVMVRRKKKLWIPRDLEEGALRNWLKKNVGKRAFRKDGNIKLSVLDQISRDKTYIGKDRKKHTIRPTTLRRINLGRTFIRRPWEKKKRR